MISAERCRTCGHIKGAIPRVAGPGEPTHSWAECVKNIKADIAALREQIDELKGRNGRDDIDAAG